MSTNNAEGFNFKIVNMAQENDPRRVSRFTNLTLEKLHAWIDKKNIDDLLKEELKKSLVFYPQEALENWQKNYLIHLSKAQKKLRNKNINTTPIITEPKESMDNLPDNEEFT